MNRRVIYSIGHSKRTPEELLALLREYGIEAVADIRSFPRSRWPGLSREELAPVLTANGIEYQWLGPGLGGYRRGGYEAYTGTDEFAAALGELCGLAERAATAFMCAEATPDRCHRRYVTYALEERGWEVVHIIGPGETWPSADGPHPQLDF